MTHDEGPFKVSSRGPLNYKIHLPGRGIETVAIERLKPAFISTENDGTGQDLDEEVPPSPPPPGRRPGPRTRFPAPSNRASRSRPPVQPTSGTPPSTSSGIIGRNQPTPASGRRREPRLILHRLEEEVPSTLVSEQPSSQAPRPVFPPPPPPSDNPDD